VTSSAIECDEGPVRMLEEVDQFRSTASGACTSTSSTLPVGDATDMGYS